MREIACVNLAAAPATLDWGRFLAASQKYADLLAQAGYEQVKLVNADAIPGLGIEKLVVWSDTDAPGALAYHEEDGPAPTGHTFIRTASRDGVPFGVPWGHEMAEQIANPACNKVCISGKGNLVAYEIADACEDQQFGFVIDGFLFSDFVLPSYWNPRAAGPYDYTGKVSEPFEVLAGGYLSILDPANGVWGTLHGSMEDERAFHAGNHRYTRSWKRHTRRQGETVTA